MLSNKGPKIDPCGKPTCICKHSSVNQMTTGSRLSKGSCMHGFFIPPVPFQACLHLTSLSGLFDLVSYKSAAKPNK